MGCSLTYITIKDALLLANNKTVTEASKVMYFDSSDWKQNIKTAELRDDNNAIYFTLKNGDFVVVE
jgi:exonuclease VII large subunit